ncbi:hypothetical protein ACVIQT_010103 [Bradyrhizobium diazoefficiens]
MGHSLNVTAWTSETQYEAGALLVPGRSLIARSGALDTTAIGNLPPAVSGKIVASGSIPSLAVPRALDPIELANNLLAVRVKMADRLIASGMADVRHEGELLRQQHEMIGNKIIEAANAMAKAKKSSRIMKFLGWLAVGLSIAAAVVNPGIVATVAAAVTVGVAVLNETGVVDKMTQAIAKRLMKDGDMDAAQANKVAIGITMGIILSVTVLTAGAGLMGGCGNGASAAASAAAMWSRLGESGATVLRGLASLAKQSGSLPTVLARAMNQAASTIVDTTSNATRSCSDQPEGFDCRSRWRGSCFVRRGRCGHSEWGSAEGGRGHSGGRLGHKEANYVDERASKERDGLHQAARPRPKGDHAEDCRGYREPQCQRCVSHPCLRLITSNSLLLRA